MKKLKTLLALLLAFAMVFCLAACSESGDDAGKDSGGKKDDDDQIIIGFNTNNLTNETMTFMVDVFEEYGKEHNIKIMTSQCNGDTATLLTNLENFVAGGADGIIFMNYDPEGVAPLLEDLAEKGIPVVSYDEYSDLCVNSWLCSNEDLGKAIGKMATDWAKENITGHVEVGLLTAPGNSFLKVRGEAIEQALYDELGDNVTVHVEGLSGGDAVSAYSNMTTANPNIKIFVSIADSVVTGIAEAWYGDLVGAGKDISEYGVFATDATDIALNLIDKSRDGEAIFRGTIDLGLKDVIPTGMIECLHAAIEGRDSGYPETNYYTIKYVTADNIDEYSEFLTN